jgi:hypothetical protein
LSFRQQSVALATLCRKEYHRVVRIWGQTILPPVINMALYFVIFGNSLAGGSARWTASTISSTSPR